MKKYILPLCGLMLLCACSGSPETVLFEGRKNNLWEMSGGSAVENGKLVVKGSGSEAFLKRGEYRDFDLGMDLRTTEGGKGYIAFHTDKKGSGYKIAVNNDRTDPVWWRMTGSLISVRNLTKSFIDENEWFRMNVRVEGRKITVSINGEPVVEYIEPENPYRTSPNEAALLSEGAFSIVSTGVGSIEFRNISVEVLDANSINTGGQLEVAQDETRDEIIRLHQEDFPVLDYHVHLKGGLTKEAAARQSRRTGINYAVAPNCGIGFPITSDEQIYGYLDTMRSQPFILAMQGEGREWTTTFSPEARAEFDFVFTDALTFTDHKGRRVHLWIDEEVIIDNEQQYMDLIVDKTCEVLEEPADVYVNPFFLPTQMNDRYDEFWTDGRVDKVIEALVRTGRVLEINELYRIPSRTIIMKARDAGIKFSFGSNNVTPDVSKLQYSIEMKKACGLTSDQMYKPPVKI